MSFEKIAGRIRRGIRDSIAALVADAPAYITDSQVAVRRNPQASGLAPPAIVVSPARNRRRPSPAGLRVRAVISVVSIYFRRDQDDQDDRDEQDHVIETIEAAFDLPPEFPAEFSLLVAEAQETRVVPADQFLPIAYRHQVDVHRLAIECEVCQEAGVVV